MFNLAFRPLRVRRYEIQTTYSGPGVLTIIPSVNDTSFGDGILDRIQLGSTDILLFGQGNSLDTVSDLFGSSRALISKEVWLYCSLSFWHLQVLMTVFEQFN